MTSKRFYISIKRVHSDNVLLEGREHHHLSRVIRARPGDIVRLFDGSGTDYTARIDDIGMHATRLVILEKNIGKEPRVRISLAQSLLKQKKMELIIQKSTELGIMRFIPVISSRSLKGLDKRVSPKIERWKTIALEASKQSGRTKAPQVSEAKDLSALLTENREEEKFFLNESGGRHLADILMERTGSSSASIALPSSLLLLVGPEGGWAPDEEEKIIESGFKAVSLGSHVLKAETAAIVGSGIIGHFWNE